MMMDPLEPIPALSHCKLKPKARQVLLPVVLVMLMLMVMLVVLLDLV